MAVTGTNVSERYKREHRQIVVGENGLKTVSASYGFPVTWMEEVKRANLARLLKQG